MVMNTPKTNSITPKFTGMQLQTSALGLPVPVVYGVTRIGWNLADYLDFKSHKTPSSSGGKGGAIGGGGKGSSSVTYTADVVGVLCEGPIFGVNSSWTSQTQAQGTPNFDTFDGAIGQSPWTFLVDNFPDHALTYSGFAYEGAENLNLGSSANLPNMNWEPIAFFANTAFSTYGGNGCYVGGDADPSLIVPDMLTNSQYGIGFPASRVGQITSNSENYTVPGSPFQITVFHAAQFAFNINVAELVIPTTILTDESGTTLTDESGTTLVEDDSTPTYTAMTCVAASPGPGQYSFTSGGVYTFNSADVGRPISIRYASLGPLTNYQNWCMASGLWMSPAYVDQAQISTLLDDIMLATYSEVIWSSGILQVVPRGAQPVSGNGHTFTPPSEPLFSLGIDDFMANSNPSGTVSAAANDDPVIVSRTRASDQINSIKVEVLDRANQYALAVVEASDQALIDRYGRRTSATKSLHLFADVGSANISAQLQLQDQYIRNHYSFQLDERYVVLDPMDLVELTDPNYPGLTDVPCRLLEIIENDDGTLSMTGEEYPGTLGTVPEFNLDGSTGFIQDFNVDPGDAMTPAIFDVPVQLAAVLGLETWLGTCSATGNPNWGGCDIYVATTGAGPFVKKGTLIGASRMGVLTNLFPVGTDPDTTDTLSVNLTESSGALEPGTNSDADNGTTLCFVDGEYVSYSVATLTSTFNYNLTTYLRRGMWGSPIGSHGAGSLFVRLDDGVFVMPYTKADVGRVLFIKLVSFNIYGGGQQDEADVPYYTHTIGGPPTFYAPQSLSVTQAIKGLQLKWINAPDVGIAATEIWRSASSSFSGATHIDDAAGYSTIYNDQNAASNTEYWYWIRHRDIAGNESQYDPPTSGPGATATTGQAATNDIIPENVTTNVPYGSFSSLTDGGAYSAPSFPVTTVPHPDKYYPWGMTSTGEDTGDTVRKVITCSVKIAATSSTSNKIVLGFETSTDRVTWTPRIEDDVTQSSLQDVDVLRFQYTFTDQYFRIYIRAASADLSCSQDNLNVEHFLNG